MTIAETVHCDGVMELVVANPPVNACGIADLHDLAQRLQSVESRAEVRAVLLRGEGCGFCAGGDLKEVQASTGFSGLLGQASGSYAASVAVAECAVPVVVAVHRYCIGVGVLLAGAADIVIADHSARFILAEIDNGATGGAIQASGLMPDKRLRAAMFTCEPIAAAELERYGTIYDIVPVVALFERAHAVAARIAAKPPVVVRSAKASINSSIGKDIRRAYRLELGYTYELNLLGDANAARQAFLDGDRGGYREEV